MLAITAESLAQTKHLFPFIPTDLGEQCVSLDSQNVIDLDATSLHAERNEGLGLTPDLYHEAYS